LVDPASEHTLELRLSRYAGQGLHEDVDLTNFSNQTTQLTLSLAVDADFADQIEVRSQRKQQGELQRDWRAEEESCMLHFSYQVSHTYDQ
jgi:hypothetical protein